MTVTIYHNPRCSKSRQTLEIITSKGIEPDVIDYLKEPLGLAEIEVLYHVLSLDNPFDLVREQEPEFKKSGLTKDSFVEAILASITEHPKLLERPIVITDKGARICRPPELVEGIL